MSDLAMAYDAELLQRVMSDSDVPTKRLAFAADVAECSLSRYFSGERTLPSRVLRAAFELTHDVRLLGLIAGNVPLIFQFTPGDSGAGDLVPAGPSSPQPGSSGPYSSSPLRIPPVAEWLPAACQATERLAGATTYLARVLADGRVDVADRQFLQKYQQFAAEVQRHLALSQAAISAKLQELDRADNKPAA